MKIGICTDRNENSYTFMKSGEIFFSPLFEMFAAMHVITNPTHHTSRLHWWERLHHQVNKELISDIQKLSECTQAWFTPMDFLFLESFEELRDMDIEESLSTIEDYPISKWKKVFEANNSSITPSQKTRIVNVARRFYREYFHQEIVVIEPLMNAALKKVLKVWETDGIAKSVETIHTRLKATDSDLVFYKDKEYHFKYKDIKKVYLTGSIFVSPHLLMAHEKNNLLLVKHFYTENIAPQAPEDLVKLYNGLADGTRLQILKMLKHNPDTTQNLALKLGISEAAVSKQLKVLSAGELVTKTRKGNYMIYSVSESALDFLTYRIYEYLM